MSKGGRAMQTARQQRHGFALLLTLVLVMIAAIALATLAQQSTGEALRAVEQTEALQRQWAVRSCRATLLPEAARVMNGVNAPPVDGIGEPIIARERPEPKPHYWVHCRLAGIDYDLVFTDEQAKYNPTTMQRFIGKAKNRRCLMAITNDRRASAEERVGVVLRPLGEVGGEVLARQVDEPKQVGPDGEPTGQPDLFTHYGQLFDNVQPVALLGTPDRPGPAERVTLWSDGRIRSDHASDIVLNRVAEYLLGGEAAANFLAAEPAERANTSLADWVGGDDAEKKRIKRVAQDLFINGSTTHGLWVVAHNKTRSWYTFSVRTQTRRGASARAGQPTNSPSIGTNRIADHPAIKEAKPGPVIDDQNNRRVAESDVDQGRPMNPYTRYDFAW